MQVTFTVPTPISVVRQWKWALMGMLVVAFGLVGGGGTALAAGNSVTSPDTTGDVGTNASMVLDAGGKPVVAYFDATNSDLKVLHCGNSTCTAGNSITSPDTASLVGSFTSIALDSSGRPVVAYYDITAANLNVLHCGNANCTAGNSITQPDTSGANVGQYTSIAIDGGGLPVVSYYDVTNGNLKILHCNDFNCAPGGDSITSPDPAGVGSDVGKYTSIELLPLISIVVVSYYDETNDDLKVMYCDDTNCAGANEEISSPDTGGSVGTSTSLELDGLDAPVVSYFDGTNGDLKVLHCTGSCGSGGDESITSPDGANFVGVSTSLALSSAGNPAVSYYDTTNGDLKVLRCNDADCAGGDDIALSPDTGGDVGSDTALMLNAAGNPVVSYSDNSNDDLRILACSDADCDGTKLPSSSLTTVNIGQYALPKTCFSVRDSIQTPLFTVCDNNFQGSPELDAVCIPDGVCDDEDPTDGFVSVTVVPATYNVVESTAAPEHTLDPSKEVCVAPASLTCTVSFSSVPKVRPWHPWDITGGPGNTPDGVVRVQDILEVVNHYFDDKPLSP